MYDKNDEQHRGDEGAQRPGHRHGHRRRRPKIAKVADDVIYVPRTAATAFSPLLTVDAAATARLPHRRRPRLRRGQAAQPGQERDGGVRLASSDASRTSSQTLAPPVDRGGMGVCLVCNVSAGSAAESFTTGGVFIGQPAGWTPEQTPIDFLDVVGLQTKARWRQLYRAPPPTPSTDRPRAAFTLGGLIGDAFLALQAEDVQQFRNIDPLFSPTAACSALVRRSLPAHGHVKAGRDEQVGRSPAGGRGRPSGTHPPPARAA